MTETRRSHNAYLVDSTIRAGHEYALETLWYNITLEARKPPLTPESACSLRAYLSEEDSPSALEILLTLAEGTVCIFPHIKNILCTIKSDQHSRFGVIRKRSEGGS